MPHNTLTFQYETNRHGTIMFLKNSWKPPCKGWKFNSERTGSTLAEAKRKRTREFKVRHANAALINLSFRARRLTVVSNAFKPVPLCLAPIGKSSGSYVAGGNVTSARSSLHDEVNSLEEITPPSCYPETDGCWMICQKISPEPGAVTGLKLSGIH